MKFAEKSPSSHKPESIEESIGQDDIGESLQIDESIGTQQSVVQSKSTVKKPEKNTEKISEAEDEEEADNYSEVFESQSQLSGTVQSLKPLQQKAEEIKADSARKQKLAEASPKYDETEEDVDEISEEEISEEVIPDTKQTDQSQEEQVQ